MRTTLLFIAICACVLTADSQTFPLVKSGNNRYLQDQTGAPFLINAESMWALLVQCKYDSANRYLVDRQSRGINTILVQLMTHGYSTGSPTNVNGHNPFTGAAFATPNASFFAHSDSIINRATALGFLVFLDVLYIGWDSNEGWITEATAAADTVIRNWGRYVGNRYKSNPNIVWVIGGDHNPASINSPISTSMRKIDSLVSGIKSRDTIYSASRLFTIHGEGGSRARSYASWVNFNFWYQNSWPDFGSPQGTADDRIWKGADSNYVLSAMPFFLGEAMYEHEHSVTQLSLRKQMYWPMLRGACGQLYGNNPLWGMGFNWASGGTNWSAELTAGGSLAEQYFGLLFRSRNWKYLIPDRDSSVLSTGSLIGTNKATTAYASDSSFIIAYVPTQRAVTIDPSKLQAGYNIHVWWYNPATGAVTDAGVQTRTSRAYTSPSNADYAIILDTVGPTASSYNQPGSAMSPILPAYERKIRVKR